jgi:serine/threonine-protein kinase HipA
LRTPANSGSRTTAHELVGKGARQYLVIERYDRAVHGETVTLIHQEDSAQALGLDWVDDHSKFQNPDAPRDPRRPSAYRIAELLGSLQGEGRPVADFLRSLTFTVLLGDNDARAKNLAILHVPGRSMLADVYDTVPNLLQEGRIDYNLARHRRQLRPPVRQHGASHPRRRAVERPRGWRGRADRHCDPGRLR